jgi:hypothetical protein
MNNFAQSIHDSIVLHAADSRMDCETSSFPIVNIPSKKTAFHLIDLMGWQNVKTSADARFFMDMSEKYERQQWRLVHLWEDVWLSRTSLVQARIAVMLGAFKRYHARQTELRAIDNVMLKDFLQCHHLLPAIGGRSKYGLFGHDEMLAAASFSAACPIERGGKICRSHEMLRFAAAAGCVVAGGMGKLIAHFIKAKQPDDIMTYVDADWGCGSGLLQLGFECMGRRNAQQFCIDADYCRIPAVNDATAGMACCNSGSWKYVKMCC